jgi:TRAP-type C4-dicarboxylate transport system permease small subunit
MGIRKVTRSLFEALTAFLIAGMVAITLLQVVSRFMDAGFEWTEELARLDLIYLTFFGSIVASQRSEHLRIEILVNALPARLRRAVRIAVDLAMITVLMVVAVQGAPLLSRFWPLLSASLGWPTSVFYFPVVAGSFIMAIYLCFDVIALIRGNDMNQHLSKAVP